MMNLSKPTLDGWLTLLENQFARRPQMQPRDIYKLLYQGLLGPEHLITSPTAFAERLDAEYESLSSGSGDPLYEPIRPDQALLRVNLRSFKASRLELQILLDACLQTAERIWGNPLDLRRLWESLIRASRRHPFSAFNSAELDEFTAWLSAHDYPAVHHSQVYSENYAPAYRLVAGDLTIT